ncbi:MAG TPA: transporter, partial [Sphingomicrobium sp.]|nr:transporter [Sphingomicrobium sp.]
MRGIFFAGLALLCVSSAGSATDEQPICPDRPSKSTGPCTVPQGKWQTETGLIDWSENSSGGTTTDTVVWGNSALKYGISGNADVELWVTPLETLTIRGGGVHERHSSFGDMLVRLKYALTKDSSPVQVALDPFIKLPTANHEIGNGKVEGGLLVPVQVPVGKSHLALTLDPELDLLANSVGHGRHLATQQVFNLGLQANDRLSLS